MVDLAVHSRPPPSSVLHLAMCPRASSIMSSESDTATRSAEAVELGAARAAPAAPAAAAAAAAVIETLALSGAGDTAVGAHPVPLGP
mmetsp:Transcript_28523/g.64583  ORF Transcript_28523/g.64583 Transcript_28523/m.64583 type:complete len:87 (-) Transcript_28523:476-736(-)